VKRRTAVRLHHSRYTARALWIVAGALAALLAVYAGVRALLEPLDTAIPSTLAGLGVAAAILAGSPLLQHALRRSVR